MNDILSDVSEYYSDKLKEYGATPRGVDWNNEQDQFRRFEQLCKAIETKNYFTLNDIGCGYGALYEYMFDKFPSLKYCGIDISRKMIVAAAKNINQANASFAVSSAPQSIADYCVASGIFNVKLEHKDDIWLEYIISTLDMMNKYSAKAFAFNCLTSYSDADKIRKDLYYADPCYLFDHCKRNYSRHVALLHDYGLWEFTIIIRKEPGK